MRRHLQRHTHNHLVLGTGICDIDVVFVRHRCGVCGSNLDGGGADRYGTMRYGTLPYGTLQYGTLQYGTLQYGTMRYGTLQYGRATDLCDMDIDMVFVGPVSMAGDLYSYGLRSYGPYSYGLYSYGLCRCGVFVDPVSMAAGPI